jgi:hypothetical protein
VSWATHYLGGLVSPVNASYTVDELEYQLRDSNTKCLFTCPALEDIALEAAHRVGIAKDHVYLFEFEGANNARWGLKSVEDLVKLGQQQTSTFQDLQCGKIDSANKIAFLCYSSGTSGLPVVVQSAEQSAHAADRSTERCDDFPSECHRQYPPNIDLRETPAEQDRSGARHPTHEPYLWPYLSISFECIPPGQYRHTTKVRSFTEPSDYSTI